MLQLNGENVFKILCDEWSGCMSPNPPPSSCPPPPPPLANLFPTSQATVKYGMAWHGVAWHGMVWYLDPITKVSRTIHTPNVNKGEGGGGVKGRDVVWVTRDPTKVPFSRQSARHHMVRHRRGEHP